MDHGDNQETAGRIEVLSSAVLAICRALTPGQAQCAANTLRDQLSSIDLVWPESADESASVELARLLNALERLAHLGPAPSELSTR